MSDFWSHFPPMNTRTHEACGAAAPAFAAALAGHLCGANGKTVFWLRESWAGAQLNPVGFAAYLDPKQLLIAKAARQIDALAAAEEALRSGHIALVVIELSARIGLTEGRRLQLAAQEGGAMGLCLIPEAMGSNAAQTRWRCTPVFDPGGAGADSTLQHWEIIKNKSGTLTGWNVGWHAQTRRINVVSKPAQR
ncbi:protein ImuA [Yoonia tamlensis]|uniref:Protein ImuA n=1 Tax=Yoonia tamlensis TaxID=390270 RepID=A0A1I6G896_9RHOB|nr:hypothetical protein [Yoonia tamlensis]SFR38341.1 protein ImuA [Yoonia tamlensis]